MQGWKEKALLEDAKLIFFFRTLHKWQIEAQAMHKSA